MSASPDIPRAPRPLLLGCIFFIMAVAIFGKLGAGKLAESAQNAAHVPAFGLIALFVLLLTRRAARAGRRDYILAFLAAVALGILVEIIQYFIGSDAEVLDVVHDALGTLAALAAVTALETWRAGRRGAAAGIVALASIMLVLALYPLIWTSTAWIKRERQFPVVTEFASRLDQVFWHANDSRPYRDETGLFVPLSDGPYPGIEIDDLHSDWSRYTLLSLELANPGNRPIRVSLRVHDRSHDFNMWDRFTGTIELGAHAHEVWRIPLADVKAAPRGRTMDLSHIAGVTVFSGGPAPNTAMWLKKLWLQ